MRARTSLPIVSIAATVVMLALAPDGSSSTPPVSSPAPILPESLAWATRPDLPGLQVVYVLGSEKGEGPYLLRVRLAADARIPPHTHPDARITTVLSGTAYVGFGETLDENSLVMVPEGGVYEVPAGVPHFAWAKGGDVEYQESGFGPTKTSLVKK